MEVTRKGDEKSDENKEKVRERGGGGIGAIAKKVRLVGWLVGWLVVCAFTCAA